MKPKFENVKGSNFFCERVDRIAANLRWLQGAYPRILRGSIWAGAWYGPGWHRLLEDLLAALNDLLDDRQVHHFHIMQITEDPCSALHVKYAFGSLEKVLMLVGNDRGQFTFGSESKHLAPAEAIEKLVVRAAQISKITCSCCGDRGTLRHGYWTHVTCDACEALWAAAQREREQDSALSSKRMPWNAGRPGQRDRGEETCENPR